MIKKIKENLLIILIVYVVIVILLYMFSFTITLIIAGICTLLFAVFVIIFAVYHQYKASKVVAQDLSDNSQIFINAPASHLPSKNMRALKRKSNGVVSGNLSLSDKELIFIAIDIRVPLYTIVFPLEELSHAAAFKYLIISSKGLSVYTKDAYMEKFVVNNSALWVDAINQAVSGSDNSTAQQKDGHNGE